MSQLKEGKTEGVFVGRLKHGSDLLNELNNFCIENNITCGQVQGIGAVQKARVAFYDQGTREYDFMEFNEELEILSLTGNVSLKDEKPFVHAHILLSDPQGKVIGGHLSEGTVVFATEVIIQKYSGIELIREFDEETGLPLWKK